LGGGNYKDGQRAGEKGKRKTMRRKMRTYLGIRCFRRRGDKKTAQARGDK